LQSSCSLSGWFEITESSSFYRPFEYSQPLNQWSNAMAIRMITGADLETEVREFTFTPEELAAYAEQAEALRTLLDR
jgi:hypothetical protein